MHRNISLNTGHRLLSSPSFCQATGFISSLRWCFHLKKTAMITYMCRLVTQNDVLGIQHFMSFDTTIIQEFATKDASLFFCFNRFFLHFLSQINELLQYITNLNSTFVEQFLTEIFKKFRVNINYNLKYWNLNKLNWFKFSFVSRNLHISVFSSAF